MNQGWPPLGRSLNDFGGDWQQYCEHCYELYYRDFYTSKPAWPIESQSFSIKRNPEFDGKCNTFWHMTSQGEDESDRTPDLERCERISWPRIILDQFGAQHPQPASQRVVWWKAKRGSDWRFVIALADFSYVVVVADRKSYVLLWTAYPVGQHHRRAKLQREFEQYWGNS